MAPTPGLAAARKAARVANKVRPASRMAPPKPPKGALETERTAKDGRTLAPRKYGYNRAGFHTFLETYTEDQVLDALTHCGGIVSWAAERLGCSSRTMWRYLNRYPRLSDAHRQLTQGFADVAHGVITNAIADEEDVETAKWYLSRRDSAFQQSDKITHGGDVTIKVVYDDTPEVVDGSAVEVAPPSMDMFPIGPGGSPR